MESIEIAKIKSGQSVTLEFGDLEPILTKLDEPRKFKLEDWYDEEVREIYILEDVIQEDEPLHYSFDPIKDPVAALRVDKGKFGKNRVILDFLGRSVDSIEMEDAEEED